MDLIAKTRQTIRKYSMLSRGDRVLAALSGGPDSVCLLTILSRLREPLGIDLYAVYIEHGLRPDETPDEIAFCSGLCLSLNVPFSTKSVDVRSFAEAHRLGRQEAARELRYKALDEVSVDFGANKIALGHTADDQAETVIMRLARGAGTLGLSGIPPVRKNIIRPLIGATRKEIECFIERERIGFVVDSSNLENKYLRNKVRHTVIPALKDLDSDAVEIIARTADIFREEDNYFELQVTKALMKLVARKTDTSIELFLLPMQRMDKPLARRILRRAVNAVKGLRGVSFVNIESMLDLMRSGRSGDRIYLPHGICAIKGYSTFTITCDRPEVLGTYTLEGPGDLVIKEASMVLTCTPAAHADNNFCGGRHEALFDAAKLFFPLQVRSRKPGDYFYPSGFGKRKKLQDYFVDNKVPRDMRDSIPLLLNDGEIIWVIGHRTDERYGIDNSTEKQLLFKVNPLAP